MDTERLKITAETTALRGRGWVRLLVRLAGLALVIAGGVNLLFGADGSLLPVTVYRGLWMTYVGGGVWPVADAAAIAVGAIVANWV